MSAEYLLSAVLFSVVRGVWGSRVLLVGAQFTSHLLELSHLGISLSARGHEVWIALETGYPRTRLVAPPPLHVVNYRVPDDVIRLSSNAVLNKFVTMTTEEDAVLARHMQDSCKHMMHDADFLSRLDRLDFDIAIVDGFKNCPCYPIVAHQLRLPFVDFYSWPKQWDARVPVSPSVVPHTLTSFGERMTFRERLSNLMTYVTVEITDKYVFEPEMSLLRQYAPQFRSWTELKRQAVLFVSTTDYILGVRQPSLPNTIHVTSLSARPARPLPAHVQKIVSTATDHGVIVMSLGSLIGALPDELLSKFLDAFSRIPQTVLLKFTEKENGTLPEGVPKNVHLLPWLPQNDVLGHARTVVFITHCGNGGLSEAIYHGVPMVGFPVFADQPHNAVHMVRRGFGVSLDVKHFTTSELVSAINEVLSNASYRSAVARSSAILKDRPMNSLQTVTFWVEHVMKFGGAHLRSHAQDMAAYEFFMIDIAAFLLTLVIMGIFVINKTVRLVYTNIVGGKVCKTKVQ